METGNLRLYNKYKSVPKNALKNFDNGTFKGTDINTMWRIKCLTEEFGPCGIGWYYNPIRTWSENVANGEVLCFAEIKLYIRVDDKWSEGISATGGSKLVSFVKSRQEHKNSDEGYKMAITDALGVACKMLGFGADIYWDNDKSKYTGSDEHQEPPTERKKALIFKPITRTELVSTWGVTNAEETILWFEKKFQKPLAEWTEEETDNARVVLNQQKKKREQEKEKRLEELRNASGDSPF